MEKKGFNVTQLASGDLNVGIHLETFAKAAEGFKSESGWVNFIITKNDTPRGKYTHRGNFSTRKSFTEKTVDSLEKKEEKW